MRRLRIILIAHDGKKTDLVEWTRFNAGTLCRHDLIATAATGEVIQDIPGLTVRTLLHGPAGGDAQAGALIATGRSRCRNTMLRAAMRHAIFLRGRHGRR